MLITLDLETCPGQSPEVRAEFLANVKPPATYKKPESIAEWMKENAEAEAEAAWRKTSFDGALGHICVIGVAIDDEEPQAIYSDDWHADEANALRQLFSLIDSCCAKQPNVRPTFIGHNLVEFDLRFLFQRCVVLGVRPSRHIPFTAKPWDDSVYDTMARWGARAGGSLDKITKAIGLAGKGDIDGSMVWDYVRDGRIAEVAEYCKNDVELTRALYKRMTFATEPAQQFEDVAA
jgi:hypothetical protein